MSTTDKKATKKKNKKSSPNGLCFIQAAFGNVIVTITDMKGETISWSSAGHLGFKGSRKGTPFAAQVTAEDAAKKAIDTGLKTIEVYLKGPGAGREPAIRALSGTGLKVLSLKDITPVPHNGCRPPKRRRI
ncbi:MAG: 30S ribosomal protein S11 [Bdellovibrionales bacterium]|nr:30S ribosomal protein S11 [Bdellovibrionales bacterium]